MYIRILVPLDGSKTTEKILPFARFLARRLKAAGVSTARLGYIGEPDNSAFCVIERRDLQTQAA